MPLTQKEAPPRPTEAEYDSAFLTESAKEYPVIDALERRRGFAVDRRRLEHAARVLACPVKRNAPCWQHGRVVYTMARWRLAQGYDPFSCMVDVGTAKGFSALCMRWATNDASYQGMTVLSVDVIDPQARTFRNSVAEAQRNAPLTLAETLAPWPEAQHISFQQSTGVAALSMLTERVCLAFIDGKHKYEAVSAEQRLLALRQKAGDVIVFDDLQYPGVEQAVNELRGYDVEKVTAKPGRVYALAIKR